MSGSGSNPLDSSSSSGSTSGDGVLPSWLPTSFDGFRNVVIGVLVVWIVRRIIDAGASVVASLQVVWGSVLDLGGMLGRGAESLASSATAIPEGILAFVEGLIFELAASTGPAAPLVVVIAWGVSVVAIVVLIGIGVRIVRGLIGVLPFT